MRNANEYINMFVAPYIMGFIFSLGLLILSIFLMVYINKADLQYLRENVFIPKLKEMQEKRKADKQSKEEEKRQQKIEELQKQIDEIQEQIDELQREQEDIGENQALYRNILNVIAGYYGNATGETQTSYEEALTSLKTMIGEKQEDIVDKQQALTEANAMLEAWTQGLDVEKNEELKLEAVKQYTAQLENDIERLNAKLADEQKKFDIYTAEKDALLAVMIGNSYPEE